MAPKLRRRTDWLVKVVMSSRSFSPQKTTLSFFLSLIKKTNKLRTGKVLSLFLLSVSVKWETQWIQFSGCCCLTCWLAETVFLFIFFLSNFLLITAFPNRSCLFQFQSGSTLSLHKQTDHVLMWPWTWPLTPDPWELSEPLRRLTSPHQQPPSKCFFNL